ncbi:chondrolectin [Boleophthalmus pectinirostris]|uniref:chondrolectin n=1 Tax=Boleophthalmus pectinirostris TaxID=150288 RepID=UPI002430E320|nr:chondrolectin [Boleophthalmus pectinirostris]
MAYFRSVSSRVSFSEAVQACDTDQGALLSIESQDEQTTIERLLQELRSGADSDLGITDGDFWIGLSRTETWDQNQTQTCPELYHWTDGSSATYRQWYFDEPSCGGEACVVMYHQPSALPGVGGAYLHQWNDDRCNMKHNFICKYSPDSTSEKEKEAPPQTQQTDSVNLALKLRSTSRTCGFPRLLKRTSEPPTSYVLSPASYLLPPASYLLSPVSSWAAQT